MIGLYFVMGATNAGKSTFLEHMSRDRNSQVGLVEVGKMMRAKYPPSFFAGQAAPSHTATEAWQMMVDRIAEHQRNGKRFAFIDGQPRDIEQAKKILRDYWEHSSFINLYCPEYVRRARAEKRDAADPEKLRLSMLRMQGDIPKLYDVLSLVLNAGSEVLTFDTSEQSYDLDDIARELIG